MHRSWGKMLYYIELAKIQQKKVNNSCGVDKKKEVIEVNITEPEILKELNSVYSFLKGFPKLLAKLFSDMDKFDFINTSSVTDREDNWDANIYGQIKLYYHIVRALTIAINKMDELKIPESQKDFFGLVVFLHDFGKSHELCKHYNIDLSNSHDKRSAYYLRKLTQEDDYKIDLQTIDAICTTISSHHSASEEMINNNSALKFLIEVDNQERKAEAKFLEAEEMKKTLEEREI